MDEIRDTLRRFEANQSTILLGDFYEHVGNDVGL